MNVVCIDDEELALAYLRNILLRIKRIKIIETFLWPEFALDYIEENKVDVVFLDIEMYEDNGIEIAKKIKCISPATNIIFVTAHPQFAVEAFKTRASGYLLKPAMQEDIEEELNNLEVLPHHDTNDLVVTTFGNFKIVYKNEELHFKRSKSLELLAYLIDKRGTPVTSNELICNLWEDKEPNRSTRSMFQNLISDIKETLSSKGINNFFIKTRNSFKINKESIDCDFYRFLDGDVKTIHSFAGEYMASYSWALFTNSFLAEKVDDKNE